MKEIIDVEHLNSNFPLSVEFNLLSSLGYSPPSSQTISLKGFITLNPMLHPNLLSYLIDYQRRENPENLTLFYKQGICGCIVQEISNILSLLAKEPFWGMDSDKDANKHLLTIGNYQSIGSIRLTYRMSSILLSSVIFQANDVSTTTLIQEFQPGDTWLTDEHINFVRLMLDQKRVRPPIGKILTVSHKTIIIDTFFYPMLQSERHTAINWLRSLLIRHDLYSTGKCTAEEMLFPINLSYSHWILIYVDFYNRTFYSINPYRPRNPNPAELQIARQIITDICKSFLGEKPNFSNGDIPEKIGRPTFCLRPPTCIQMLPIQDNGDSINCGVYTIIYMLIFSVSYQNLPDMYIGLYLPSSVHALRILILSWLLRGEIFFPNSNI